MLATCRCAAGCNRQRFHAHGVSLSGRETQQRDELGVQAGQVRKTVERHRRQFPAYPRRCVDVTVNTHTRTHIRRVTVQNTLDVMQIDYQVLTRECERSVSGRFPAHRSSLFL